MTLELKNHLLGLSNDAKEAFCKSVARRVREGVIGPQIQDLKDFILVLPEMIAQVRSWLSDAETASRFKKLHGYMVTYLYHPEDFIPESREGLFGYLDDAYLAGRLYTMILSEATPDRVRFLPNTRALAAKLPGWLALVRRLIPTETRHIDRMLDDLKNGDARLFEKMMHAN